MISDSIQNSSRYNFGPVWNAAFEFLKTLTPESETGRRLIQGDALFAGIDCYETKARDDAKIETHRKYVDIQVLLSGTEVIEIFPKKGLTVSEPYIPERDVEFYQVPGEAPVKLTLTLGQFVVFFPEDAHMPCLMNGNSAQPVQKVVVKLRADQLNR